MAVHIRLQRHGTKHKPFYHIVAADHRCARDGRFLEKIGYYDPRTEPSTVVIKEDRFHHWYGAGAHLTDATKNLAKIKGIKLERNKTHEAQKA